MPTAIAYFLGILSIQLSPWLPSVYWLLGPMLLLMLLLYRRYWIAAAFILGLSWSWLHGAWQLAGSLPLVLEGEDILIQGRLVSLPVQRDKGWRFEFEIESLANAPASFSGKVRLYWYRDVPELHLGQRWQLQLRLKRPRGFLNPGGFDYEAWLWQAGIRATGYVRTSAENRLLAEPGGFQGLGQARQQIQKRLHERVPPSAMPLIAALSIGDRSGFDSQQWANFRATGSNHLVAISGLHIGMVAGVLLLGVGRLWRLFPQLCLYWAAQRSGAVAALLGATLYAGLAGFTLPTQRALIMLSALLLPLIMGRQSRSWQGLGLALILVLTFDPRAALAPGFLLSFAAVGAILWHCSSRDEKPGWLRQLLRMQWAVTLALTPLLMFLFQQLSWLSFVVNLIAIPWFSLVLVPLTFVAVLLLLIWPDLGAWLFGWLAPLYSSTLSVLDTLATQGNGLIDLAQRPAWALLLSVLGALWLLLPLRLPAKPLALFLFLPLLRPAAQTLHPGEWEWVILDVGQGLAQLVRTQHHLLLYDAGPAFSKDFNAGEAVVVPYLKSQGIGRIDRMILSHDARDHSGGAQAVLNALPVASVMGGEGDYAPCRAGNSWRWDGVEFRILNPDPGSPWQGNNASCVLSVQQGDRRLLLTGDLEREGEQRLQAQYPEIFPLTLVQVGHHGSRTSSSTDFVRVARPELAIISSGYRNRYGFPAVKIVQRWRQVGSQVWDTQDSGAIRVRWQAAQSVWEVERYRETMQRFWRSH